VDDRSESANSTGASSCNGAGCFRSLQSRFGGSRNPPPSTPNANSPPQWPSARADEYAPVTAESGRATGVGTAAREFGGFVGCEPRCATSTAVAIPTGRNRPGRRGRRKTSTPQPISRRCRHDNRLPAPIFISIAPPAGAHPPPHDHDAELYLDSPTRLPSESYRIRTCAERFDYTSPSTTAVIVSNLRETRAQFLSHGRCLRAAVTPFACKFVGAPASPERGMESPRDGVESGVHDRVDGLETSWAESSRKPSAVKNQGRGARHHVEAECDDEQAHAPGGCSYVILASAIAKGGLWPIPQMSIHTQARAYRRRKERDQGRRHDMTSLNTRWEAKFGCPCP